MSRKLRSGNQDNVGRRRRRKRGGGAGHRAPVGSRIRVGAGLTGVVDHDAVAGCHGNHGTEHAEAVVDGRICNIKHVGAAIARRPVSARRTHGQELEEIIVRIGRAHAVRERGLHVTGDSPKREIRYIARLRAPDGIEITLDRALDEYSHDCRDDPRQDDHHDGLDKREAALHDAAVRSEADCHGPLRRCFNNSSDTPTTHR